MKKHTKISLICIALSVACLAASLLIEHSEREVKPKYIFYFIGDGLSFNHTLGTEQFFAVKEGKSKIERLNYTKFDTRNFVTNYSASHPVTDSAAAGTALATGCKTANANIGVDVNGNELRNLTDVASEQGYMVGLVTNVGINHATPSSFYGHTSNRYGFPNLVNDYIASPVAFISGSTIMDLKSGPANSGFEPVTTADLAERVRNAGITLTLDVEEAANAVGKRVALVAYDKENKHVPYVIDRKGGELTLLDSSRAAINYLSNNAKDGFFLMVEGGKLDYAAHEQDAVTTFYEVREFAQAIDLALEFAKQHPRETLIVVTSDHETGGMSLGWDQYEVRMERFMAQKASAIEMTKIIQQMRAEGKRNWSDYKQALSDNLGLWSLVPVSKEDEAQLKHDFYNIFMKYGPMVDGLYNKSEFLVYDAMRMLNKSASIDWTSMYHTGMYTPIFATGAGEKKFLDCRDQTDIPKTIARLMGGEL